MTIDINNAKSIWLTGLSGAGKTTLSKELAKALKAQGITVVVFDGDEVRKGLCRDLQFSPEDREENIRRIAEVSCMLAKQGITTINSFIQPTESIRKHTENIVGSNHYLEIYVNAPIEVCESRDVKGLYKKARLGLIKDFTGINAPFEIPCNAHLEVQTDKDAIDTCVKQAVELVVQSLQT